MNDAGARQNMNSFVGRAALDDIDNLAGVMLAADMAPTRHGHGTYMAPTWHRHGVEMASNKLKYLASRACCPQRSAAAAGAASRSSKQQQAAAAVAGRSRQQQAAVAAA